MRWIVVMLNYMVGTVGGVLVARYGLAFAATPDTVLVGIAAGGIVAAAAMEVLVLDS